MNHLVEKYELINKGKELGADGNAGIVASNEWALLWAKRHVKIKIFKT